MSKLAASMLAAAVLLAVGLLAGCTDVSIEWAEQQIANGNYAAARDDYVAAHQFFAAAAKEANGLSRHQRRLVMDGLCRTEYQIGTPSYSLAQQRNTCAMALNEPDSESAPIFREIARKERAAVTETINAGLAQHDIATVDDAILRYRSLPGNYPEAVEQWTRQAWTIVNNEAEITPGKAGLSKTISHLSLHFPHLRNVSDRQFRQWVENNMTIGGMTIVSNVDIGKRAVGLWLDDDQIDNAERHLDRFVRVNDGLVVRCRCNGRTTVGLKTSGLPAYLVRLQTDNRQSEVLILYQP
jgi:hypothetical protein